MSLIPTLSGTQIVDGIEYKEHPPPNMLVKAMEYQWAQLLINKGELRLCPLSFYQALESDELGDRLEGQGELRINSHPYSLTSLNENFIWCCSNHPDSQYSTLLNLDDRYDVVIKVLNTVEFVKRIANALRQKGYNFSMPQVGRVSYNRKSEITLASLQSQKWQWNVFQKSPHFEHQNEYRFVFSALSDLPKGEAICISIGNCEDIIELAKI